MAAPARRPGLGVPDREGRAGAHRDAEDVRPAARARSRDGASAAPSGAAKRLLFPTDDGELVLLVHLMTAGRLKYLAAGEKGPKKPAFALEFAGRREARPDGEREEEARRRLAPHARSGRGRARAPRPGGDSARRRRSSARSSARESRRLHALLRDQRLIAGIGRAWANEILHTAKLSPYALSGDLDDEEVGAARGGDPLRARARPRATRGGRVRREDVPRPPPARRAVPRLRHADRAGRLRGAHDLLLPDLPDRRPRPQGPADVAAAAVIATDGVVTLRAPRRAIVAAARRRAGRGVLPWFGAGATGPRTRRMRLGRRRARRLGRLRPRRRPRLAPARRGERRLLALPHRARQGLRLAGGRAAPRAPRAATPSTRSPRFSSTRRTCRRSPWRDRLGFVQQGEVNGEPFFIRDLG